MNKHIVKKAFVNKLVENGFPKEVAESAFIKYGGSLLETIGGAALGAGSGYVGGNVANSLTKGKGDILPILGALLGGGTGGYLANKSEPSLEYLEEKMVSKKMEELKEEQRKQVVAEMQKRYYGGSI